MSEISDPKAQQISGNILIYILGAIFLMGLLIVLLKGNFQEGVGIDAEQTALKVTEVRRYAAALERGVNTILQNGRSESEIRFAHPDAAAGYGAITSDPGRQVFSPDGGDVEYLAPPAGLQTTVTPWAFGGETGISGVGTSCGTSSCAELIAFLMYVPKDFCVQLNNTVGITNPSSNPPSDTDGWVWLIPFTGTYGTSVLLTTGNETYGKMEGCVESGSEGTYHYYRVLLAR